MAIGTAYGHAWKHWGTLLNTQISVGLRVFGGCLLMIVPGIVLACTYAVAIPAVVVEGTKAVPAIHRSRDLSQGFRRKVFNILFMLTALNMVTLIASASLLGLILDLRSVAGSLIQVVVQNLVTMTVGVSVMARTSPPKNRSSAAEP